MGYICTICTDFIEIPGEKPVSTSCGHTFHDKCIREWLGSALKCPLCNRHTTVSNIHSLYLSSENNQSTANRSRLQNNLKSAAINLRQAKEELVKAKETLKAAELKASDALAVNRYLESENNRKAPFEHQLKYVKEECEKLKSEKVALERTKYSLAVSITEKNAIISQKDKSIEALEAQIRKQKSEIAQHQSVINSKESLHQHALNRQACLHRNSFNIQDDLYQEILKDKENRIALLQRERDVVVEKIAVDYYDMKEIQNDIKDLTSINPDFTVGQVLQETHQANRKTDFFSFLYE